MIKIEMKPATAYRTEHYGILLTSTTLHNGIGRGWHNPSFPHAVEVWENRNGQTPDGKPTTETHTVLLSAQSIFISDPPPTDQPPRGESIAIGDVVELHVNGFPIGRFRVESRFLGDPVMTPWHLGDRKRVTV